MGVARNLPPSEAVTWWCEGTPCCDPEWERAYSRFETPAEEVRKFVRRFRAAGVDRWPREAKVVDLFCGRGNGLVALAQLGFQDLAGVDLAPDLVQQYRGPARMYVGDCRELRFPDGAVDAVVIQGGLHHLPRLPDDLQAVLGETARILKPGGRLLIVEPWQTPFLSLVHALSRRPLVRRLSAKVDALETMIEREETTYRQWLGQPRQVLACLEARFQTRRQQTAWGKLVYLGEKPSASAGAMGPPGRPDREGEW